MTVSHTTVLSLLGKEVSFSVLLTDEFKTFFPDGVHVLGVVQAITIYSSGDHQILVNDDFFQLSNIDLIL